MATNKHIIDVQTKGAKKSEKQIKGVGGALGGLAKQAGIAAAAYFGTTALLSGVQKSIDLFAKQELAEKKLRFAAGASTSELIKQAQALQQTTIFGDEAIIAQQAYVKSLGISTEQTKEIIAASVDLAAAMGISLESAVMNTTKTLSGMQGELGEKLPAAFKELTAEQLKAGEGIEFIRKQFKNTAEIEAKSMTGALEQMRNAAGDAQEALGKTLEPVVTAIAKRMKSAAEAFKNFVETTTETGIEKTIREIKELGGDTKELELSFIRLEQSKALQKMGGEARSVADIDKEITEQINKQNTFTSDRIALEQEILQQTKGKKELQDLINQSIANSTSRQKDERTIELERLQNKRKEFEENHENFELNIENLNKEKKLANDLEELRIKENSLLENKKVITKQQADETRKLSNLEKATIQQGSESALKSAYSEAKANLIAKIMKSLPFPASLLAAAGTEALISQAFKKAKIQEFATGADYVTSGPEMIMVGDNPSGQERVQVTPLGGDPAPNAPQNGINLTFNNAIMTQDFVEGELLDSIKEGLRLGGDIGIN